MSQRAADLGATVILSARREAVLREVAATLPAHGGPHEVLPVDLTNPDALRASAKTAGRVDYLINNGGISQRAKAIDTNMAVLRRLFEINFFGYIELTKAVLPQMLERGTGHIAAVSSVVGHIGTPMRSAYAASKHALHGYYNSLRYEVEQQGLGVTIICPGYIHTDISKNAVVGDGSAQGTMDVNQANGMSPERFAEKAWKGLLAGKPELHIGGQELAGIYLNRFAPGLLRKIVRGRAWDGEVENQ